MAARTWGWWSGHKLDILERYLQAFAVASTRVDERIYLDLFAGRPDNLSRETNTEILGSVHRALSTSPPFTRVHLFELPPQAQALQVAVDDRYPGRNIRVHPGDCNLTIADALTELRKVNWAPTFAFIDQQAAEVRWETLERIARFRDGKTKAEMWILFGTSYLPRGLQVGQAHMNAEFGERISALYGCDDWRPIVHARRKELLTPRDFRTEMVNLMRWRLEQDLGYRSSHAFTMKNTNGHDIHDMIFVTDHAVGEKIMGHLYGTAMAEHAEMRNEAYSHRYLQRQDRKYQQRGQDSLFVAQASDVRPPTEIPDDQVYRYEPPSPPYGANRVRAN